MKNSYRRANLYGPPCLQNVHLQHTITEKCSTINYFRDVNIEHIPDYVQHKIDMCFSLWSTFIHKWSNTTNMLWRMCQQITYFVVSIDSCFTCDYVRHDEYGRYINIGLFC